MSAPSAAGQPHPHTVVDDIERLIQVDVGRHVTALFEAARGGLWSAASALAAAPSAKVGLITGFYVPLGSPPAAETDGPVGTALLAKGLAEIDIPCRLATDEPCYSACAAALAGAGATGVPVDATDVAAMIATWRSAGITHAISIERCGRSADGAPRNMRGLDISSYTAPLDELFTEREQEHWRKKRHRYEHLAGRFAGKEAVLKAFGTRLRQRMRWTDVEIVSGSAGRPGAGARRPDR